MLYEVRRDERDGDEKCIYGATAPHHLALVIGGRGVWFFWRGLCVYW